MPGVPRPLPNPLPLPKPATAYACHCLVLPLPSRLCSPGLSEDSVFGCAPPQVQQRRAAQRSDECHRNVARGGRRAGGRVRAVMDARCGPVAEELRMCGWGPYAREASVWVACCWCSGVINMS